MPATYNLNRGYQDGDSISIPVADNELIYEGAAIGSSSGYGRPLVAGDTFMGFAYKQADNTQPGHTAGGIYVQALKSCVARVYVSGAAVGDWGKSVYASADQTFTYSSSGNSYIGRVVEFFADGNAVSGNLGVMFDISRSS